MPVVKTKLSAIYTEEDIKALIIADLAKYGHTVTISNIWPTGCGPNDIHMPTDGSVKTVFVDEYTVGLETINPAPPPKQMLRSPQ